MRERAPRRAHLPVLQQEAQALPDHLGARLAGKAHAALERKEDGSVENAAGGEGPFYRADEQPDLGSNGLHYYLVGRHRARRQMCILREVMPPGSDTGETMLTHDGEEGGVVMQGQVEITVGEHRRVLGPGEAYYFDSRQPHRFRNIGHEEAVLVSASTPPTF